MQSARLIGHAPRTRAVSEVLPDLPGCIGCDDCRGLCRALVELVTLPETALRSPAQ